MTAKGALLLACVLFLCCTGQGATGQRTKPNIRRRERTTHRYVHVFGAHQQSRHSLQVCMTLGDAPQAKRRASRGCSSRPA